MFFAKIITKDTPFVYNESEVQQVFGDVITISNITLAPSSKDNASVFIKKDGEEFLICTLTHQNPHLAVNLYVEVAEYVEIIVKGNGIVHIIGFFEPENVQLNHLSDEAQNQQLSIKGVAPVQVKKAQKQQIIKVKSPENKPIQKITQIEQAIDNVDIEGNNSDSDQSEEDGDISQDNNQSEQSNLKGLQDLDDDIGDQKPTKQKNNGVQKQQPNNHKQHNHNGKPNQSQNSLNHNSHHQQLNKNNNNHNNNKNHQNIKINGQHKHFENNKKNKQQKQH